MTSYMTKEVAGLDRKDIMSKAEEMSDKGYRIIQMCATSKNGITDVLYSYGKDLDMEMYKVDVPEGVSLPSITSYFWSAFIFENEIHDLFDVKFTGSVLDYKGNFFKLSTKTPWKTVAKGGE